MVQQVEREMFYNGEVCGYIIIYVFAKIHLSVLIFEFKPFQIICDYKKENLDDTIQAILLKLWIVYADYKTSYIDTKSDTDASIPCHERSCNGYMTANNLFEYDDFCNLQAHSILPCNDFCVHREIYASQNDIFNHISHDSIDIYIKSKLLNVIYQQTQININIAPYMDSLDKVFECIFSFFLPDSKEYIAKTTINNFYTYNQRNMEYMLSCDYDLPIFDSIPWYEGSIVVNECGEFIFIKK